MSKQKSKEEKQQLHQQFSEELRTYSDKVGDTQSSVQRLNTKKRPKQKLTLKKVLIWILIVVVLLILIGVIGVVALYLSGKGSLFKGLVNTENPVDGADVEENGKIVHYDGKTYRYNDDITNILIMGIDQEDMIDDEETIEKSGAGQADTLFLVSIDTKKKKTSILNISRESVVDVDIYDVKGQYYGIKNEPICLAYAYGDGRETSCENTVRSATRLLYGIPIQSYASLNLSGIAKLNDAVGGVNVEVLEDIPYGDSPLTAGEQVTLIGDNAELYVRYRDVYSENIATNNDRMARQKQYIQAYIKKVFSQMKYNITLPLELYQIASDYMVTNIGASKVSYLASQAKDCGISDANIITIPGKTFEHNGHAWYNVDNDKLFRIILDTYYTQEN